MREQTKVSMWQLLVVFIISLTIFSFGNSHQEIIGFESRFYLFALEMWRHGPNWFPSTYHNLYPDYLGTSTLGIYLFAKSFQQLSPFIAILPTALAAAMTMVATYLIGSLYAKDWGLIACCWLILIAIFLQSARTISLDILPTCFTAWAYYFAAKANLRQRSYLLTIMTLLTLSFICRGPIGFIIPTSVLCCFYLIEQQLIAGLKFFFTACISLIVLTGLLLYVAFHVGGEAFMYAVINMQIIGRMQGNAVPISYYFTNGIFAYALAMPVFIVMLLVSLFSKKTTPRYIWQLIAWVAIIVIGMSLPHDKKLRYILPIAPALALVAAYPFTQVDKNKLFYSVKQWTLPIIIFLPVIYLMGLAGLFYYNKLYADLPVQFSWIAGFLIAAQFVNLLCWGKSKFKLQRIFLLAALFFAVTYSCVVQPVLVHFEASKAFVEMVEAKRVSHHSRLVFFHERPDGLAIKYLVHMQNDDQPYFVENEQQLLDYTKKAYFVTGEQNFANLSPVVTTKIKVIATGNIGHVPVVVFKFN